MDITKIIICIAIAVIGIITIRFSKCKKTKYWVCLACVSAILGVLDWRMLSFPVFALVTSYVIVYHTNIIKKLQK
jgi:hypothetical protein